MTKIAFEWGLNGIEAFRRSASIFVIVDVLSFSTAVSVAIDAGAEVIPFEWGDAEAARQEAARRDAVAASPERGVEACLTLSPASLRNVERGTRVLLPSPNGSRLSLATGDVATFCSSLRNFEAVAEAVRSIRPELVAVIAAGERWRDGTLRPAVEDLLGAGALVSALEGGPSAEAAVAASAYKASKNELSSIVRASTSGRELIERGFATDVEIALEVGRSSCAPKLNQGVYC